MLLSELLLNLYPTEEIMAVVSQIDLKRGRIESTVLSGCCRQGEEAGDDVIL